MIDTETLERIDYLPFPEGVRPFKLSEDEKSIFAQLSYCHCIAEYDIAEKQVVREIPLPIPDFVHEIPLSS